MPNEEEKRASKCERRTTNGKALSTYIRMRKKKDERTVFSVLPTPTRACILSPLIKCDHFDQRQVNEKEGRRSKKVNSHEGNEGNRNRTLNSLQWNARAESQLRVRITWAVSSLFAPRSPPAAAAPIQSEVIASVIVTTFSLRLIWNNSSPFNG